MQKSLLSHDVAHNEKSQFSYDGSHMLVMAEVFLKAKVYLKPWVHHNQQHVVYIS